jgi:nuclear pore complex protein Nup98-Nup96
MIAGGAFGTSGAFGQPASQPAAGTPSIFGQPQQQQQQQPASGSTFGGFGISQCSCPQTITDVVLLKGANAAAKPIFGQPAQSTAQTATGFGGMFGTQQQQQQPQQQQAQQPQTGNLFGNTGGSMFGQPQQQQQQQQQQPLQTGCRSHFSCDPTN